METQKIDSYSFSNITFTELQSIVDIHPKLNDEKFTEWFGFSYNFSELEDVFLENLIKKHRLWLPSYQEDTLKVKFIGAILNQVDFSTDKVHDWYHASLSGFVNGIKLSGFADYMVAKGEIEPQKPYFFIQEFKPSIPDRNPEIQLLAEMLVAIEKNQAKILHGGYIIGRNWIFVILEKVGENSFQYFVSKQFDALELPDLKQIYVNLKAIKHKYCQD
jgi:hypothetical protein